MLTAPLRPSHPLSLQPLSAADAPSVVGSSICPQKRGPAPETGDSRLHRFMFKARVKAAGGNGSGFPNALASEAGQFYSFRRTRPKNGDREKTVSGPSGVRREGGWIPPCSV